ncbi:MAG TPA: hypothetical protein VM166_15340 [Gemmatimonadaceae bacterium]|nr:hypothetical protein [Gemmatimonadaceae bacterium]
MFWFFERGGERLQCEIRPSVNAAGFELEITGPDGEKQLEYADDANALAIRWHELEVDLKVNGWTPKG